MKHRRLKTSVMAIIALTVGLVGFGCAAFVASFMPYVAQLTLDGASLWDFGLLCRGVLVAAPFTLAFVIYGECVEGRPENELYRNDREL